MNSSDGVAPWLRERLETELNTVIDHPQTPLQSLMIGNVEQNEQTFLAYTTGWVMALAHAHKMHATEEQLGVAEMRDVIGIIQAHQDDLVSAYRRTQSNV